MKHFKSSLCKLNFKYNNTVTITQTYHNIYICYRKLDLNHDFVSQVQEDARKVLCVVVGSAELDKDGSVSTHTAIKGEESAEVTPVCNLLYRMLCYNLSTYQNIIICFCVANAVSKPVLIIGFV